MTKLWLQAKFSNFWMPLGPIKNIFWFSHNKWDKHLFSSKKDLSRMPIFVSHNGIVHWTKHSKVRFSQIRQSSAKGALNRDKMQFDFHIIKDLHITIFSFCMAKEESSESQEMFIIGPIRQNVCLWCHYDKMQLPINTGW